MLLKKEFVMSVKKRLKISTDHFFLKYSDSDYKRCGYPVRIECKDVCIKCCRELNKVIETVTKKLEGET